MGKRHRKRSQDSAPQTAPPSSTAAPVSQTETAPTRPIETLAVFALLFATVFLYAFARLDPSLSAFTQERFFADDTDFFLRIAAFPAGIARYTALFLTHYIDAAWNGALLWAVLTTLTCAGYRLSLTRLGAPHHSFVFFFPALFLLWGFSRVDFPLDHAIASAAALLSTGLLVHFFAYAPLRHTVFVLLATLLYAACGWAVLPAALLYTVHLAGRTRSRRPSSPPFRPPPGRRSRRCRRRACSRISRLARLPSDSFGRL